MRLTTACYLLAAALSLAALPAAPAGAQGLDRSLSLAVGADQSGRQPGLTVEGRFSQGAGHWSHDVGLSLSLAPLATLDICSVSPGEGCLEDNHEPILFTAFYEPHLRMLSAAGRPQPYVGARLSAVRGWSGLGAGLGAVVGIETGVSGWGLVRLDAIADYLVTRGAATAGAGWHTFRAGVRLGVGLQLPNADR